MKKKFDHVFQQGKSIFTEALIKNDKTFTKSIAKEAGKEYREWNPMKSKPAAAIMKGLKSFPLKKGMKVLYLGAASGATISFFSDIVGENGIIYGVEISERSLRDLNDVAERRGNIVPIIADARKPEEYSWIEKCDIIFEDVASDDQPEIMIRNADKFLKTNGFGMLALKARSIDVTKNPQQVYKVVEKKLKEHFEILEKVVLDPYEKDHAFYLLKK
ncbi:MAG: fibrillarin-like rRNA/tRNA 2'-O-methyltransferase [Candidatus Aenigmarchaeota archaeon]|nr:fibrillarin-like rRNA/tRNA 2'-O-methyltransferase [Candidatus Aenigmarchaeota archaeon]